MQCLEKIKGQKIRLNIPPNQIYILYYSIIFTGPPISPNPLVAKNATHLTLMWSPPFLWPGQRIQHYNISVSTNNGDGRVELHVLDTSLTNPVITATIPINSSLLQPNTRNMLFCVSRITFNILPFDGSVFEPIQTFNISDRVWTFPSG